MYHATILWRLDMLVFISSNPTARIVSPNGGYYQDPTSTRQGLFTKIRRTNLWRKPPSSRPMCWIMTQVSAPDSRKACTMARKNILNARVSTPYRPSILNSQAKIFRALWRLEMNENQSSSVNVRRRPMYLNGNTVSIGQTNAHNSVATHTHVSNLYISEIIFKKSNNYYKI